MRCNERSIQSGRFISCPGNEFHITYSGDIQPSGEIKLVESGKTNIQEEIESYRKSTELSVILDRFNMGDLKALHRYEEIYEDVSAVPVNLLDAQSRLDNLKIQFDLMPIEIKNKFDNNFNLWLGSAGSQEWFKAMEISPVQKDSSSAKSEDSEASVARSGAAAEGE